MDELEKAFEELRKEWDKFLINFNNHTYLSGQYFSNVPKSCYSEDDKELL